MSLSEHTKRAREVESELSPDAEDPILAEALDEYLQHLQEGRTIECGEILEKFPELQSYVDCLTALDSLAPPSTRDQQSPTLQTIVLSDGGSSSPLGGLPSTDTIEASFGKYELLEEIGRGGMGVIFKARQHGLDRLVALKLILSNRLASADEIRRFYQEAKAAGGLKHPNIVGIHEVGDVGGQHFFAMDYIEGESLAEVLSSGPLDAETAAQCLLPIVRAVEHLHGHKVIHRDLKPSNILIDDAGAPFVTDFGLARVETQQNNRTQTGTIIGTPAYMAPEQAAGKPREVTQQSDVYSLGAILYEMICGQPTFNADNPLDTLVQVLEAEPQKPSQIKPEIPHALELICLKCLEKDPERRYGTASELADDLERFLTGEPVSAHETGVMIQLRRWARREPAFVSQMLSVLCAATIVQVKYMLSGVDLNLHIQIMSVFAVWAVANLVFMFMVRAKTIADRARYGWLATDVALLTTMLYLAARPSNGEPLGPLLIAYPAVVVASGLYSRVNLVWFTTIMCIVGYTLIPLTIPRERIAPHYPIIFVVLLALIGFIVAYQVHRLRVLGRYYESRRQELE